MDDDLLADPRRPLPDRVADDISPQEAAVVAVPNRPLAECTGSHHNHRGLRAREDGALTLANPGAKREKAVAAARL